MASKAVSSALRLITFDHRNLRKIGAHLDAKYVVDLTVALGIPDMKTFLEKTHSHGLIEKTHTALKSGKNQINVSDIKIRAPIYNPEKIICVGLNYLDHAIETGMKVPSEPILFSKYATTIIGPGDAIVKPNEVEEFDWEVELVLVIGKEGRRIKESEAFDYVAGYTVGNDVSARDWQLKKPGGQWMGGKTWDTFAPIGPAIVTKVSDPHNLGIKCVLDKDTVQNSNTKQLIFKTEKMISYISTICTLKPGDLIFTGTPPGVGMSRKPPKWMNPGETVTCSIDELGSISNPIVAQSSL